MQTLDLDLNKRYSYADYLTWLDDKRRELFNGFIKLISPAPLRKHQIISTNLLGEIHYFLKKKKCEIYSAPFDVRFPKKNAIENKNIHTVLQPDISIICDLKKLDRRGCLGAPDMIIEIVSGDNPKRDVEHKFNIYQEHGVREYWTVFPEARTVNVFLLNDKNKYSLKGAYAENGKVKVNIFDDLHIELEDIFTYKEEYKQEEN